MRGSVLFWLAWLASFAGNGFGQMQTFWTSHVPARDTINSPHVELDHQANPVVVAIAQKRLLIIKYSTSGAVLWQKTVDEWDLDNLITPAIDETGSIVVAARARVQGSLVSSAILMKLAPDGTLTWSRELTEPDGNFTLTKIAIDQEGRVVLFGSVHVWNDGVPFLYLAKYSAAGDLLWERRIFGPGGTQYAQSMGFAFEANGNLIVTGYTGNGNRAVNQMLVRFSPSGEQLWSVAQEVDSNDAGWVMTVAPEGDVFVGAKDPGGLMISKYSPAGELLATVRRSSDRFVQFRELKTTVQGSLIALAHESKIICFDKERDDCISIDHGLIIAFDSNLNELWSAREHSRFLPAGLSVDAAGNIFVISHELQISKYSAQGTRIWGGRPFSQRSGNGIPDNEGNFLLASAGDGLQLAKLGDTLPASPRISIAPSSITTNAGATIILEAVVSGATSGSYEWVHYSPQRDEVRQIGAGTRLVLTNVVRFDEGFYSVRITNEFGRFSGPEARITIVDPPAFPVSSGPQTNLVRLGSSTLLERGLDNLHLTTSQWFLNGKAIAGATNLSLSFASVQSGDAGTYTLVLSNMAGIATSAPVHLSVVAPGPLDRFEWLHPFPQGNDIRAGAHGNGLYLLAAGPGIILVSSNAAKWTARSFENLGDVRSIVFGKGVFVLAGSGGTFVSSNGTAWSRSGPAASRIAYGNETFVAVRESGNISVSSDGLAWTDRRTQLGGDIAFGNGIFVANRPDFSSTVGTSTNGVEWYARATPARFERIRFGHGVFVASAGPQTFVSTNGMDWRAGVGAANRRFLDVAAGPRGFIAVGEESGMTDAERTRVFHSVDGLVWSTVNFRSSNNLQIALALEDVLIVAGDDGNLAISTNGMDWSAIVASSDVNLRGIARGTGGYVAVGQEGTILFSGNAKTWTKVPFGSIDTLRSVAFGNGRFVMAADSSLFGSADGHSWHVMGTGANTEKVLFADGRFVGLGRQGTIFTSTNGFDWEARQIATTAELRDVAFGQGKWIVVGDAGTVAIASDSALTWTVLPSVTDQSFARIAFGNNRFLVATGYPVVGSNWISSDGLSWRPVPGFRSGTLDSLAFGGGRFVASDFDGRLFSSEDGVLWVEHARVTQNRLRTLAFIDGAFMAVGNNLSIICSGHFLPKLAISHRTIGTVEIEVESNVGPPTTVEFTTDLQKWLPLVDLPAGIGRTNMIDESTAFPSRFYRVKQ